MRKITKVLLILVFSIAICVLTGLKVGAYLVDDKEEKMINSVNGEKVEVELDSDKRIIETMHKMTHQKVISDEQQGFIKMTPENIKIVKRMINESTPLSLKYVGQYRVIIDRWENGDFSLIVREHNMLSKWLDGNNGKAYKEATPEQERAYLLKQAKAELNK
ncbi:DUF6241 domain-containing protein [Bacillus pseudomycoides]|uniref:DUF6241 domain-containing protein n=1 Tax=Bacillus pseudomycoides TaxID=64104 RepID=UPI000BEFAE02|nr:DUF6241 domain-containing protein [Bacillus pseudomycoides]PEM33445.1 hypothetical protein CN634_28880 [Bacillus pseudomycoides]